MSGVGLVAYLGELARMPARDAMQRAHEVLHYVGLADERYRRCETTARACGSGSSWPRRWCTTRSGCCWTSRPAAWIPAAASPSSNWSGDLARNKGLGVILSTHLLADVEAVCKEILVLREGRLLARQRVDEAAREPRQVFEVEGFGGRGGVRPRAARAWGPRSQREQPVLLVTLDWTIAVAAAAAGGWDAVRRR